MSGKLNLSKYWSFGIKYLPHTEHLATERNIRIAIDWYWQLKQKDMCEAVSFANVRRATVGNLN